MAAVWEVVRHALVRPDETENEDTVKRRHRGTSVDSIWAVFGRW
jgi:hypothetical protein